MPTYAANASTRIIVFGNSAELCGINWVRWIYRVYADRMYVDFHGAISPHV